MNTIRWGMIGCGNVTEVKSGPGFQKAAHSRLVACMRRNAALAEDYARRHQVPRWYDDADKLIHDPEVDAVYVATPPSSHKDCVLACARAGKPAYVEKPMSRHIGECEEMIAACRAAGVPLFVAYYRRALPRFLKIKEIVDSGLLGDIRLVTVTLHQPPEPSDLHRDTLTWRVLPEESGGGRFVDMGCHTLDFLDFVLGPIARAEGNACCQAGLYPAEDTVTALWEFTSGVPGTGSWCFVTDTTLDLTEIVGSRGKIGFSSFGNDPLLLTVEGKVQRIQVENPLHIQQPFIQTIVDELNGSGTCPSHGESGARTTWVIDEILKTFRQR